jgi:hypothetical protein
LPIAQLTSPMHKRISAAHSRSKSGDSSYWRQVEFNQRTDEPASVQNRHLRQKICNVDADLAVPGAALACLPSHCMQLRCSRGFRFLTDPPRRYSASIALIIALWYHKGGGVHHKPLVSSSTRPQFSRRKSSSNLLWLKLPLQSNLLQDQQTAQKHFNALHIPGPLDRLWFWQLDFVFRAIDFTHAIRQSETAP